jgi:hypothetical protein
MQRSEYFADTLRFDRITEKKLELPTLHAARFRQMRCPRPMSR